MDVRNIQFADKTREMTDLAAIQEMIAKETDVTRAAILSYRASQLQSPPEAEG